MDEELLFSKQEGVKQKTGWGGGVFLQNKIQRRVLPVSLPCTSSITNWKWGNQLCNEIITPLFPYHQTTMFWHLLGTDQATYCKSFHRNLDLFLSPLQKWLSPAPLPTLSFRTFVAIFPHNWHRPQCLACSPETASCPDTESCRLRRWRPPPVLLPVSATKPTLQATGYTTKPSTKWAVHYISSCGAMWWKQNIGKI